MSAVEAEGLTVRVGAQALVGPVSFDAPEGGSLGLRGPSGAGKSTILRALVGLLPSELRAEGHVRVLGVDPLATRADLPALRASAALVGQVPVTFPASVLANVTFGLRHVSRLTRRQMRERAEAALVEAGLWDEVHDRLESAAAGLSVGQRQRLCLARALAVDPQVLLLDEPTSALDAAATSVVEGAIAGLDGRRAVVVVSHDPAQLDRLCDRVLVLPRRPDDEVDTVGGSGPESEPAQDTLRLS